MIPEHVLPCSPNKDADSVFYRAEQSLTPSGDAPNEVRRVSIVRAIHRIHSERLGHERGYVMRERRTDSTNDRLRGSRGRLADFHSAHIGAKRPARNGWSTIPDLQPVPAWDSPAIWSQR